MKKFIMAALSLFFFTQCALGFSACNADKGHEHVFEEEWRHNAQSHWHFCTVPGCNERSSEEAHDEYWQLIETTVQPSCFTRGEGKYKCSVCGEIKQDYIAPTEEHEYPDNWSSDGGYHYKRCVNRSRGCLAEIREAHIAGEPVLQAVPRDYMDGRSIVSCTVCGFRMREIVVPAKMIAKTFKLTVTRNSETQAPFFYYSELDDNWHITVRASTNETNYFYNYAYSDGMTAGTKENPSQPTDIFDYNTTLGVGVRVMMTNLKTNTTVTLLSDASSPVIDDYASCYNGQFRLKQSGSYKFVFSYSYTGKQNVCSVTFIADAYFEDEYNAWIEKWNSENHAESEKTNVLTA